MLSNVREYVRPPITTNTIPLSKLEDLLLMPLWSQVIVNRIELERTIIRHG